MTQTLKQALAAIEAAKYRVKGNRVYDYNGTYVTVESGYCNADWDDYCEVTGSRKSGGASGAFKSLIRAVLATSREQSAVSA